MTGAGSGALSSVVWLPVGDVAVVGGHGESGMGRSTAKRDGESLLELADGVKHHGGGLLHDLKIGGATRPSFSGGKRRPQSCFPLPPTYSERIFSFSLARSFSSCVRRRPFSAVS